MSRRSGKVTAARTALDRWSDSFDYAAAAGKSWDAIWSDEAERLAQKGSETCNAVCHTRLS